MPGLGLTPAMLRAAGAALAQAHARTEDGSGQPWSHGDLDLDAFRSNPDGRAALAGFAPGHPPGLAADERHADDLLALLLDLMGRTEDWPDLASAFLVAYGRLRIRRILLGRLYAEPSGNRTDHLEALRRCPPFLVV